MTDPSDEPSTQALLKRIIQLEGMAALVKQQQGEINSLKATLANLGAAFTLHADNTVNNFKQIDDRLWPVIHKVFPGGAVAFSQDGQYLFLTVGDRQRFTPAQDPDQPIGKVLRLTLDGKPAPGNPNFGKMGAATIPLIDPPTDSETAKAAKVVSTYTFPTGNMTPAETWTMGHRTPYGLAMSATGELWELEHGPRGGDELNLIEKGKNYGWPLVEYANNYDGVPIPNPDTRPDFAKPAIYWVPVVAPGNLMFYKGKSMFPAWDGNGLIGGMGTQSITRIIFDGKGGAKTAERWAVGKRVRDIAEAPDGSLWMIEDANPGALIHITPKP